MKTKILFPIFFSILIGFLFGKVIFNEYDNSAINVFEEGEKIYFIELTNVKENNDYLTITENNVSSTYAGITKNKDIALKIKEFYKNISNNIYVREKYVTEEAFLNILTEYDKIAKIAINLNDVASIEKIVISNYKEMVLENGLND